MNSGQLARDNAKMEKQWQGVYSTSMLMLADRCWALIREKLFTLDKMKISHSSVLKCLEIKLQAHYKCMH